MACVLSDAMHYTRKFGRCPILNKIHHEGTKGHEVLFDRIYRMIRISAVEGASRESLCDSLWIKTGCALSEQAPSGPAGFDPATLSPCEAWFGVHEARGREEHEDLGGRGDLD